MDNHAPADYECPFCHFARGGDTAFNTRGDIVYQDDEVMAFVSPRWWPNNPGNVIVIPRSHVENLYSLPDELLSRISVIGKRLAVAMKAAYGCDGTSTRQHNEPAGDQDVFHFHLHVFPRYVGDDLYRNHDEHRFVAVEERRVYARKLKAILDAQDQMRSLRRTIATDIPNLRLVALTPEDADAYYALVDRNRTHLTQHGDWQDLGEATPESVQADLAHLEGLNSYFGMWLDEQLIGRVDLNPRTHGNFVLSYWLGGEFTGNGYATAACKALIAYGKAALGATTIWAGVTKGNTKSEALLGRLGFQAVADRGTYTRFTLPLT